MVQTAGVEALSLLLRLPGCWLLGRVKHAKIGGAVAEEKQPTSPFPTTPTPFPCLSHVLTTYLVTVKLGRGETTGWAGSGTTGARKKSCVKGRRDFSSIFTHTPSFSSAKQPNDDDGCCTLHVAHIVPCNYCSSLAMSMWRGSTADVILQGDHRLDLRDRSLSTQDVTALAKLLSTSSQVSALILYNVRLNSDVSATCNFLADT